jgi:hypothetical protein
MEEKESEEAILKLEKLIKKQKDIKEAKCRDVIKY